MSSMEKFYTKHHRTSKLVPVISVLGEQGMTEGGGGMSLSPPIWHRTWRCLAGQVWDQHHEGKCHVNFFQTALAIPFCSDLHKRCVPTQSLLMTGATVLYSLQWTFYA